MPYIISVNAPAISRLFLPTSLLFSSSNLKPMLFSSSSTFFLDSKVLLVKLLLEAVRSTLDLDQLDVGGGGGLLHLDLLLDDHTSLALPLHLKLGPRPVFILPSSPSSSFTSALSWIFSADNSLACLASSSSAFFQFL